MIPKQIDVDCPCCNSRLAIDVLTGKVVRWVREEQLDETGKPAVGEADWERALGNVEGRHGRAADKFDQALGKEQTRTRDLDELFDQANRKLKEDE